MSKLEIKKVSSFMGPCILIKDTETGKNVEIMGVQLTAVFGGRTTATLPHGGYDVEDGVVTIYHDEDREKHEIICTIKELEEAILEAYAKS